MSLLIGLLTFANDARRQEEANDGVLGGSLVAVLAGWIVMCFAPRDVPAIPGL